MTIEPNIKEKLKKYDKTKIVFGSIIMTKVALAVIGLTLTGILISLAVNIKSDVEKGINNIKVI
jgi:hypothetical protein